MNNTNATPSSSQIHVDITRFLAQDPRVKALSKVSPLFPLLAGLGDWLVVIAAAWVAEYRGGLLPYFLASLIIAGRFHGLLVLCHEAAHLRVAKNKLWNDRLSDWFFAFPLLFDTEAYRLNHHQHHLHLNSGADPDWARKQGLPQWDFPLPPSYVAKNFFPFLLWNGPREWGMIALRFTRILPLSGWKDPAVRRKLAARFLHAALLIMPFFYFHGGALLIRYWLVPLFVVFPLFQRIRSVAEHFGLAREHDLNQSRNVHGYWIERILLAPHHVGYHLDHHLAPSVPFHRLPKLHAMLLELPVYQAEAHQNSSYALPSDRPLWRDLFGAKRKAEATEIRRAA